MHQLVDKALRANLPEYYDGREAEVGVSVLKEGYEEAGMRGNDRPQRPEARLSGLVGYSAFYEFPHKSGIYHSLVPL